MTMRVYTIPKPEGIDSLVVREAPTPHPGRSEVLVRMRAASLNYRDLMVLTGRYAMNRAITVNQLRPVIDQVFSFDQAREAYGHLQGQSHFGKAVIGIG